MAYAKSSLTRTEMGPDIMYFHSGVEDGGDVFEDPWRIVYLDRVAKPKESIQGTVVFDQGDRGDMSSRRGVLDIGLSHSDHVSEDWRSDGEYLAVNVEPHAVSTINHEVRVAPVERRSSGCSVCHDHLSSVSTSNCPARSASV